MANKSCQAQAELTHDEFSDKSYLLHMYRGVMPSLVESDPQGRGSAQRVQKSQEIAESGQAYAQIAIFGLVVEGWGEAYHGLLEVMD
eukprot:scaffold291412_cov65-Attheya_sp.AAC.1